MVRLTIVRKGKILPWLRRNANACLGMMLPPIMFSAYVKSLLVAVIIFVGASVVFLTKLLYLQLFDGHNGSQAAIYTKENLLGNVLNAIPPDLNREEWVAALPRALVAGFVKTDKDLQERGICSFFSSLSIFLLS